MLEQYLQMFANLRTERGRDPMFCRVGPRQSPGIMMKGQKKNAERGLKPAFAGSEGEIQGLERRPGKRIGSF